MPRVPDNAVFPANLGLFLARPPFAIPFGGIKDGINFRVKDGRTTTVNLGWDTFGQFNPLNGPITLIDNFFTRSGSQIVVFGTTKDLYEYDQNNETVDFITPRYETGTASVSLDGTSVTGSGTTWSTNLKAGDEIAFGSTGIVAPTFPNLVPYSEQFDNTSWSHAGLLGPPTANTTVAPDGTTTADTLTEGVGSSPRSISRAWLQANKEVDDNTDYEWSVSAKPNGRDWLILRFRGNDDTLHDAWFNVTTGVVGTVSSGATTSITAQSNGFYRCTIRKNTGTGGLNGPAMIVGFSDADGVVTYTGNGTSGMILWGADLRKATWAPGYRRVAQNWYEIDTVNSDTSLTLRTPFREPTVSAVAYTARKTFTGDVFDYFRTATFFDAQPDDEDKILFTNGVDDIMIWNGTADQVSDAGLTFTCKELGVFKNLMVYAHIIEDSGEIKPTSIKNSDASTPLDVVNGLAGEFVVNDGVDPIVGVLSLSDNLMLYGERSVINAQFVGDPLSFIFRTAVVGVGPITGRAIADFGDFHEFLGTDSQFTFDGVTLREVGAHVWREILRVKSPNRILLTFSHFDEEFGDLIWAVPLTSDTNPTGFNAPNTAFVEHYLEDTGDAEITPYSKREFPFTASGFFQRQTALTWDQIADAWSDVTFRWNDQFFDASFPFSLVGDENGNIYTLNTSSTKSDGTAVPGRVRFGRHTTGDAREKNLVKRVYPFVTTLPSASWNLVVKMYGADTPTDTATLLATMNYDLTGAGERFVNPMRRSRFFELEFSTSEAGAFWEQDGYTTDIVPGGSR